MIIGYLDPRFRGYGLRVQGFRGLGFRSLGFRGLGCRIYIEIWDGGYRGLGFRIHIYHRVSEQVSEFRFVGFMLCTAPTQ